MASTSRLARFPQAGFTLMELMVGMTIGMIATIIIVQVMSVFEAQKRTTTGTADAQTNGGIALYSIGREMAMAGFPLYPGVDTPLACTTTTSSVAGLTADLTPVAITEVAAVAGVSPASDKITIRYGSPLGTGLGTTAGSATGVPSTIGIFVGGTTWTVGSNLGCQVGDVTVINTGTTCAISTVTAVSAGVTPSTVTLANANGAGPGASLACVGAWNEITYEVDATTGNLKRTAKVNGLTDGTIVNGVTTGAFQSVVGIVNIQAQYGISSAGNVNQVSSWVDASGGTWATVAGVTPTVANRNRIKAIRIAVVARNAKIEQSAVTTAQPVPWTSTTTFDGVVWPGPTITLGPGVPKWDYYRYRVFETTIPLRNVIWSKDTL